MISKNRLVIPPINLRADSGKANRLKYLFPCTGNCGSTFITKYMLNAGVKCGHEDVFQPIKEDITLARPPGYLITNKNYEAEASCFSNPWLKSFHARPARVIHLVRNPFNVVRAWSLSLGGIGVATYFVKWLDIYNLWPYKTSLFNTGWRDPNFLAGVCVQWNRMVTELRPEADVLRIEDASTKLMPMLGLPEDTEVPPRDTNSKVDKNAPFELRLSDEDIRKDFNEWAEQRGYRDFAEKG